MAPNTSYVSYPSASLNVSPAKARAVLVSISVTEHLSESLHTGSSAHLVVANKAGFHSFVIPNSY